MLNTKKTNYLIATLLIIMGTIIAFLLWPKEVITSIPYEDVQGIGYSANGNSLLIATDSGLYNYRKNYFSILNEEKKTYYGFNTTLQSIYTSGTHLNKASTPLGIIRSSDNGESFEPLVLNTKTYFQGLSVGYETDVIYVFNPNPNELMDEAGIYRTTDEGKSWTLIKAEGLRGSIVAIEAHPTISELVIVSTSDGIFVSENQGDKFDVLSSAKNVTAIHLNSENKLFYATSEVEVAIYKQDLTKKDIVKIPLPKKGIAAVDFLKVNPKIENEIVVATTLEEIMQTFDGGEKWLNINE